ncbi:MAG: homoserine dehydrogenase [Rickettsiales bacterium]|jgi:homoserine dehydrogenase|nr:homoserine dehydrogenase [Rickettsiales bacterium]
MKEIKVVVAGVGVVGSNVVSNLAEKRDYFAKRFNVDLQVVAISSRSKKDFPCKWYNDPIRMIDQENPDIVCELIGGDSGVAHEVAIKTLSESRTLITANKALLAKVGNELLDLAKEHNAKLYFEAAVGGALPIVQILSSNLNYNKINAFSGILNGTANYILTNMHKEKQALDVIISRAQELGLAESDPTFDICGIDAGQKLAIMNSLIYNVSFKADHIKVIGIDKITVGDVKAAEHFGARIKLVAGASFIDSVLSARVAPSFCVPENFLYNIDYAMNAVNFKTDMATDMALVSHGAGGVQTAHAVLSDIQACITNVEAPICNMIHEVSDYKTLEFYGNLIVKTNIKQGDIIAEPVNIDGSYYYLMEDVHERDLPEIFEGEITYFPYG